LNSDLENEEALKLIISILMQVNQHKLAKSYLFKLSKIKRNDYTIYADFSYTLLRMSNYTKAEEHAKKSLRITPNSSAYYILGLINYIKVHNYHKAIEMFTKAIKLQKEDNRMDLSLLHHERAVVYLHLKYKILQAIDDLELAKQYNVGDLKKRKYPGYFRMVNEANMENSINNLRKKALLLLKSNIVGKDVTKW